MQKINLHRMLDKKHQLPLFSITAYAILIFEIFGVIKFLKYSIYIYLTLEGANGMVWLKLSELPCPSLEGNRVLLL